MQTAPLTPRRTLEFGIYRDGDNNLDAIQESVVAQAVAVARRDPRIAFAVEDTSAVVTGRLATHDFDLAGGTITHDRVRDAEEMSDPKTLATFVARTLDQAEASGAQSTWIDLVDHGGGDGGGLETSDGRIMPMPKIASAIAQGVALHARAHPEDAALWTSPAPGTPSDAQALARLQLVYLEQDAGSGLQHRNLNELTQAHLQALAAIAHQALQARATIAPPPAPAPSPAG
jgi:hypothetical protein